MAKGCRWDYKHDKNWLIVNLTNRYRYFKTLDIIDEDINNLASTIIKTIEDKNIRETFRNEAPKIVNSREKDRIIKNGRKLFVRKIMKKKIKINMSKLSIGGMEKALIDLLNNSELVKKYEVTLMIVYNENYSYLDMVPKNIEVEVLYKGKWNLFGKTIASFRLLKNILFPKKYYASICYPHQHGILATITRKESKNNIIFIHTDLLKSRTDRELNNLMKEVKFEKFKKVVCVSECAKNAFLKLYPNYSGVVVVANNYIDGKDIIDKSKLKVNDIVKKDIVTFINVARHDDMHKKVSRIIIATKRLNDEQYNFRVILVGDGVDHQKYIDMIEKNNIKNIILTGSKSNPFPYYNISDAFVFSSAYEGYGIVLNEARVLNIPIITSDVADAKTITEEGYGILCENSENGIYEGMKQFLDFGYVIKKRFNYKKFNDKITDTLNQIVEE